MSKRILVVDDSPFIRLVLRGIIEKYSPNSEVIEAGTGASACAEFRKVVPDLVFLDIIMPEAEDEGVNVLRRLKDASPQVKVIMVTAVGHDAMIERCKKIGITDYIVKPFDDEQIEEVLKKHLGGGIKKVKL